MPFHPPSRHPPLPSPFSIYKIRGGETLHLFPLVTDVHDIEMGFLSYISIEIEIISDD